MTRIARAALKQAARTDKSAEPVIEAMIDTDTRLRYRLIYDQLKNAIALGRIAPGLVLLEGPVARIFGTSRVPVRKAFELLHADELLRTFEGRGYLVAASDGGDTPPLRTPLSESAL